MQLEQFSLILHWLMLCLILALNDCNWEENISGSARHWGFWWFQEWHPTAQTLHSVSVRKTELRLPRRVAPGIPELCSGGKNTICIHIHIIVIYWDVYKEAFLKSCLHITEKRSSWSFIRKFHFPKSCLLILKCCHWFYNLHSHYFWEARMSHDTITYIVSFT